MPAIECPVCPLCGKNSAVELTEEEFKRVTDPGRGTMQDVLPDREPSFRELLISGTHPSCWDDIMGDEEE